MTGGGFAQLIFVPGADLRHGKQDASPSLLRNRHRARSASAHCCCAAGFVKVDRTPVIELNRECNIRGAALCGGLSQERE